MIKFPTVHQAAGHVRRAQFDIVCKNARFPEAPTIVGFVIQTHYDLPGNMEDVMTQQSAQVFNLPPDHVYQHVQQSARNIVGFVLLAEGHPWHGLTSPPGADDAVIVPVQGSACVPKAPSKWRMRLTALLKGQYPLQPIDAYLAVHVLMRKPLHDLWELTVQLPDQQDLAARALTTEERYEVCRQNVERVYRLALMDLDTKGLQPVVKREDTPDLKAAKLSLISGPLIFLFAAAGLAEAVSDGKAWIALGWGLPLAIAVWSTVTAVRYYRAATRAK